MRTRIIRDGIELPWLAVDDHYNFDYQANRPFTEYRKVFPGDHIVTGKYDKFTNRSSCLLTEFSDVCRMHL